MSEKLYNKNPDPKVIPMMNPRISFSNNAFLHDSSAHSSSSSMTYRDAPVSDFEFSAGAGAGSRSSIMSADELFSKGRLLPSYNKGKLTTLRDELEIDDDDSDEITSKPPKNPSKLKKGFLGFRKSSHISSKKLPVIKAQESAQRSSQDSGE